MKRKNRRKNGLGFTKNEKYGIGVPILLRKHERSDLIKELNLIEKTDLTNILDFQYKEEEFPVVYSKTKPWIYIYPWQLKELDIDFKKPFQVKCFGLVSKRERNFILYIKGE